MTNVTIYHNPECGTSRNTLALLRLAGVNPLVIEYLQTPPTKDRLRELIGLAGLTVRETIRHDSVLIEQLGLNNPTRTDEDLLDAMVAHPILINRPIVVTPTAVKLCRPSEIVLDLLPAQQLPIADATKDDHTPFVRDERWPANDDLALHVEAAGLPIADLKEPGRTFYRYSLLDRVTVGFGGFELYGTDVLLRSLCVMPKFHGQGIGRNMTLLLARRAFDQGARRAFAFASTPQAQAFHHALRFQPIPRTTAPPSILATQQATGLCPSSAQLFERALTL